MASSMLAARDKAAAAAAATAAAEEDQDYEQPIARPQKVHWSSNPPQIPD